MSLELLLWCPVRTLHLVSQAVANLLKNVSQEGGSGHPPLHSIDSPIVNRKSSSAPRMQQDNQGSNSTLYCRRGYPPISVSTLFNIIIRDFERAAELHLGTNPIIQPQVSSSTLRFRV